jgi:hypothetical protein
MKFYAAVGANPDSVKQVSVGCNQKVILPAGQAGGIDFILDQGSEVVAVSVDKVTPSPSTPSSGLGTGALIGIIVGSVLGGAAIAFLISCLL